jgi:hypothetical protein
LKARITALFLRLPFLRKPHMALDVWSFAPIFSGVRYMRAQVAPAQKNPPHAMRIARVKVFLEREEMFGRSATIPALFLRACRTGVAPHARDRSDAKQWQPTPYRGYLLRICVARQIA